MHVRIQSWAPYDIQVYVNGREWLARQMDRAGIGYKRSDNKIIAIDDAPAVEALCEKLRHTEWPAFLDRQAALVNPLLPDIKVTGVPDYWWVLDQCEYATDILFRDRAALEAIKDDLVTASVTTLGAVDVMHFLGRKPHHAFTGEVTIDSKKRPEGIRVRFRLKANGVKFYDHANVLRIETTINNPREFKVLRMPRLIGKLRGHGLIAKVKSSRLYRFTPRGVKAMGSAIRFRKADFPQYHHDIEAAMALLAA